MRQSKWYNHFKWVSQLNYFMFLDFLRYYFSKALQLVFLGAVCSCFLMANFAFAAGGGNVHLSKEKPVINLKDKASLQSGAKVYINHCLGCHSLKYLRYERLAQDLSIPVELVEEKLIFTQSKVGDSIESSMPADLAKQWFGAAPPDLTLQARRKGSHWLYSYLVGFHSDSERTWGVNNTTFPNVGMPHVLETMEQRLDEKKFKKNMSDLTNFLVYASEPVRLQREKIGTYVIIFLLILFVPIYFLNKAYWRDVH